MEIQGKRFDRPHVCNVVFTRNGEDVAFFAQSVLSYAEFERLCPLPQPERRHLPNGEVKVDTESLAYQKAVRVWSELKTHFMVLESLKATATLKWDKVIYDNPSTWALWEEELREAFFTQDEVNRIFATVSEANSLDEAKLEEARKRFLASLVQVSRT